MDEEEIVQPNIVHLINKKDDSIILVDEDVENIVDLSGDNTTPNMEPPMITEVQVTLVDQLAIQL